MGHDQEVVKQLQRRLKDWNPKKVCKIHASEYSIVRCCDYSGGRLQSLHLCNIGLEQLPSELWQFPSLENLYLSHNLLRTLPAELGKFAILRELDLSHNQLQTLPAELSDLSTLKKLNLSHNKFSLLPAELGDFSTLKELDLSYNQLQTLPMELGDLSTLEELDLSHNKLSVLPAQIGNISALRQLNLPYNQLRTVPAELGNLFALWSLDLSYNQLQTLPVELGDAPLTNLELEHNNSLPQGGLLGGRWLHYHYEILDYLQNLPKQPSNQLVDRPSPSENALVSPQIPDISREKGVTSTKETVPLKIFYCYAHEDKDLRDRIDKHLGILKRLGQVIGWYDREIQAGTEWEQEIEENLGTASIILLLVSADFVNSDYCYGVEMQKALKMHEKGETRVLPILLRPVDWQGAPFAKLQILPTGAKPITRWPDPEEALEDVARQIRAVVSTLHTHQS